MSRRVELYPGSPESRLAPAVTARSRKSENARWRGAGGAAGCAADMGPVAYRKTVFFFANPNFPPPTGVSAWAESGGLVISRDLP